MKISLSFRLLMGRLLTRSGDQAWDFAVPIVLLKIMPGHLRIAAFYYLLIRLGSVILLPRVASIIDTKDRLNVIRMGLVLQFVGVLLSAIGIFYFWAFDSKVPNFLDVEFFGIFLFLVFSGLLGTLGASLMDIAIANDLAPSVFSGQELSRFNSRFRQVDLITEVGSPVIAGFLLAISDSWLPMMGFLLVVVWNLISFFPEYGILKSVFRERPDLQKKFIHVSEGISKSFTRKIVEGWREFFRQPVAPAILAYALLWLSVLSPHGVLLTGFLQDGWRVPECIIGLFRGSGAFFGLAATVLFTYALKFMDLKKTSWIFLAFQTVMVIAAYIFFLLPGQVGQNGFLILILFSRIGLYGFSLGEIQIRQERIPAEVRGQVNGFANALAGIATLALFAAGASLPTTEDFGYLVLMSIICVFSALVVYTWWIKKTA